jgi:hypothetical protein
MENIRSIECARADIADNGSIRSISEARSSIKHANENTSHVNNVMFKTWMSQVARGRNSRRVVVMEEIEEESEI